MYVMYIGILKESAKDHLEKCYDDPFEIFEKRYELTSFYRTPDVWRPLLGKSTQMDWGSWLYVCNYETVQQLFKIKRSSIARIYPDRIGTKRPSTSLPKADWYGIMEVECY